MTPPDESGRREDPRSSSLDPPAQHRAAAGLTSVPCAVVTLSDSRSEAEDVSGRFLRDALAAAGHRLVGYRLIKDEPEALRNAVESLVDEGALVLLCTGGTGVGSRDRTIEALAPLWEQRLPGFGELLRMLSYQEVGAAAMLSRADAGVYRGAALFALPGSTAAVQLAWTRLIQPEIRHLALLLNRP